MKKAYSQIVNNVKKIVEYDFPVMGTMLVSNSKMIDSTIDLKIPITKRYLFDEEYTDINLLKNYSERLMKIDYVSYQYARRVNSCLYGIIFISSNQKVYPCPGMRAFELGDLHKESLAEVLHKGDFLEYWYLTKEKVTPCKNCKYRMQCFDCLALEFSKTGNINEVYYCNEKDVLVGKDR